MNARHLLALAAALACSQARALEPALEFDGTDDAATCGTAISNFDKDTNWSVLFIANVNNYDEANNSYLVGVSRDTTADGHQLWFRNNVATDQLRVYNNSSQITSMESSAATAGTFFIHVLRNTGSGTSLRWQIFNLAGTQQATITSTGWNADVTTPLRFTLGNIWTDGTTWLSTGYFDGRISHVTVLDGETLSDGDVSAWVADPVNTGNGWIASKSSTLKLWLQDASDISGGAIQDYSPANNDCTIVGGTTFTASGPNIPALTASGGGPPFGGPFRGPFGGPF